MASLSMRQTIGHHRLAHMALKGPPNFIDREVFVIGKWLRELETRGKISPVPGSLKVPGWGN